MNLFQPRIFISGPAHALLPYVSVQRFDAVSANAGDLGSRFAVHQSNQLLQHLLQIRESENT